jgi:hypothetical protein
VFFRKTPRIEYVGTRRCHIFECASGRCKARNGRDVRRFLDTTDRFSTSNLRKHAKTCWGDEAVAVAADARDVETAHEIFRNGSIVSEFQRNGKGKIKYSTRQHTKAEAR